MTRAATLALGGALLAVLSVGARVAQEPPKVYSPDVAIEPASLNLHMLDPNEVKKVEFKVKNVSDQPIKIDSVLTSCRCVETDFDQRPVAPGASGVVRLSVTAATAEAKKAIAWIYTSGMRRNVARFDLEYAVIPEPFTQPVFVDFGRAKVGDKAELAVKVVVHLPRELAEDPVLEPYVKATDLPIKLTVDPQVVTKIREDMRDLTTTMHLVLDTSQPLAAFETSIVFQPKAPHTYRAKNVRLVGEVRGAAWFEHGRFAFGVVPVGKPTVLSIRLYCNGAEPPKLEEAVITPANFTEKHEVEADRHCIRFDLTCTPTDPGPVTGELVVRVASLAAPLKLPLSAQGR